MSLRIHFPQPPLSEFVELMWSWEGYHPKHQQERILPTGQMEINFNLCDEPLTVHSNGEVQQLYNPFVIGSRSESFLIDTARPASLLSVYFKPGGAFTLFGVSAAELHNRHVSLDALWGQEARFLFERLLTAQSVETRFSILETALMQRLLDCYQQHQVVPYALKLLKQVPHQHTIADISGRIALSKPQFIRVFRDDVGLSPKKFSRVIRFQRALQLMAQTSPASLANVAYACGYYDQAHFNNEFKAFAGITPSEYAPQSPAHFNNLPVIN